MQAERREGVSVNVLSAPAQTSGLAHRLRRMGGRDPGEAGRTATTLELFFDLTFVVSFGIASSEAAHYLAEGHAGTAVFGFVFAMFAIVWAWINNTWFSSAFDTDDWFCRIATMVQMVGVIVLALGLPAMVESLDRGAPAENLIMIVGYVIMRVALVAQWLRAAVQSPSHRRVALTYALSVVAAQLMWISTLLAREWPMSAFLALLVTAALVDVAGPSFAERRGTPWHAHHLAERYTLLTIIALGEIILGTVTSVSALIAESGWSAETFLLLCAGVLLAFGMWWIYGAIPAGHVLEVHRHRAFVWGYGHIVVFVAIAAVGAGLHLAAYAIEGHTVLSDQQSVLAVAIPVALYLVSVAGLNVLLIGPGTRDLGASRRFQAVIAGGSLAPLLVAVLLSAPGVDVGFGACLAIIAASPLVLVIGWEISGHIGGERAIHRVHENGRPSHAGEAGDRR